MTKKANLRLQVILTLVLLLGLSSCSKETLQPEGLTGDQLTAGRLDGTWASPRDIATPPSVPTEIFGTMRLVFTTDGAGNPSGFIAQNCPIIFGNATPSIWHVTGSADSAKVNLAGVGPVDNFNVKVTSRSMILSFFMGWENTETKATGKGNFKVTLTRQ